MELKYQDGLIPAIIQDKHSGKVLMLGYMNQEAYDQTLKTATSPSTAAAGRNSGSRAKPQVTGCN